ncbi:hypothetical protein [Neorhizobium petrolearium]|uniref:hypothetical protein n=1 Tax=Neorhizobium petrolearium TaxID=515361 RepID=UPI003F15FC37
MKERGRDTHHSRAEELKRLRAGRQPIKLRLQSGQTGELLAMAIALQAALRSMLEELAVVHDLKAGDWLDELETTLIRDTANIWSEGLSMNMELAAVERAQGLILTVTGALRAQLDAG